MILPKDQGIEREGRTYSCLRGGLYFFPHLFDSAPSSRSLWWSISWAIFGSRYGMKTRTWLDRHSCMKTRYSAMPWRPCCSRWLGSCYIMVEMRAARAMWNKVRESYRRTYHEFIVHNCASPLFSPKWTWGSMYNFVATFNLRIPVRTRYALHTSRLIRSSAHHTGTVLYLSIMHNKRARSMEFRVYHPFMSRRGFDTTEIRKRER